MIKTLFLFLLSTPLFAAEGIFINPITDICWECMFPITISGVNVTPDTKDLSSHNTRICVCPGVPPKVGSPLTFWEPLHIIDVTLHPYRLIGLGGVTIGKESVKNRGSIGIEADTKTSFYHVHWYQYPIMNLLDIMSDFSCIENGELDIAYMTEFDPLWNDDLLSAILNPEAALFSSPLAHMACAADCIQSSRSVPADAMFWCAGCEGSLYPFTGTVAHHVGAVQASSLLVQRTIAKLHRMSLLKGFEENEFCEAKMMPIIKKSLYKTQMVFPVTQTNGECHLLGKSDVLWGSGKSFPKKGEDFAYIIWSKKQCCLDAVKPIITGGVP